MSSENQAVPRRVQTESIRFSALTLFLSSFLVFGTATEISAQWNQRAGKKDEILARLSLT
jgi:hypothetical protein